MKVFVSSTSRDLADFRAAAIRALRRLGHEVVAMEDFTAATAFPLERVLNLVHEADAYVLIVAWRYGFIPDCSKVSNLPETANEPPPKSITELEYLAARRDRDRPILPFILSETAPWPPQNIDGFEKASTDDPGSLDRIRTFRAALTREHIVSFFSRPDELEALVGAAITTARLARGVLINSIEPGDPVKCGTTMAMDSSYSNGIADVVRHAGSERVITIDIADVWWSTRLYLLAFLLDHLTRGQRILVVCDGKFVGLLPLTTIVRVIAAIHPQIRDFERGCQARAQQHDVMRETDALITLFEESFRRRCEEDVPTVADVDLPSEETAKVVVTEANLRRWFHDSIVTNPIRVNSIERASPLDLIRLFDYPGDFVPVIVRQRKDESEKARSHVIDKPALSLALARAYVTDLLDETGLWASPNR